MNLDEQQSYEPQQVPKPSSKRIYIFISIVIVLLLLIGSILLSSRKPKNQQPIPSNPTPTSVQIDAKKYQFTPLQKTTIGETTDQDIKQSFKIESQSTKNGITQYNVTSDVPGYTNALQTKDGVVIFEQTNTKTLKYGSFPKLSTYEDKFGQPETIIKSVGSDWITNAYVYASKGFTLLVNRATLSVYEIQRYNPMSVDEYKKQFADFIKPQAPKGEKPF